MEKNWGDTPSATLINDMSSISLVGLCSTGDYNDCTPDMSADRQSLGGLGLQWGCDDTVFFLCRRVTIFGGMPSPQSSLKTTPA